MATTFNWIYLGTLGTQLDPTEGNTVAENLNTIIGSTFGSAGNPLYTHITSTTMLDRGGGAGALDGNNNLSNDQFSTDIGAGVQTFTFDISTIVNATVTYADGTTGTVTAVLAQSTTGQLFLVPETAAGADTTVYEAKPIVSITFNSAATYSGNLSTDRQVTGFDDGFIEGTAGNDLINASYVEPIANGTDKIDGGDGISSSGTAWQDDRVRAGAGNDTVLSGLGNDYVDGGTGADSIDGGDGNDSLFGGTGTFNDTILGGLGNDTIDGDAGNDSLLGGAGADSILGGLGNDYVDGGTEADYIDGGDGNDSLFGGTGAFADTILGGIGNDTIDGGDGNDSLLGGAGTDSILGGAGNDYVDGGTEADYIDGGNGNDSLFGGAGAFADTILGGIGNDTIDGGDGNDSLLGGAGTDNISGGAGDDYVDGGDGSDSIDGGSGNDTLIFGLGDDTVLGGDGNDLIDDVAGSQLIGNNLLDGGAGNDTIFAGGGSDTLLGGANDDQLFGEDGNDSLDGGTGNDSLDGGSGNDTLSGGAGNDTMTGGLGSDRFLGLTAGDVVDGSEDPGDTDNDILDLFGSGWTKANTNIIFSSPDHESGTIQFLDNLGNVIGTMSFSNIETIVPCFTPGTLIETDRGPVPVEMLTVGDTVLTMDHGFQPLRWVGRRDLTPEELVRSPRLRPILIGAGALGPGMPSRNMRVSPQHRILMNGASSELISGETEVLAPAQYFVGHPGIVQDAGAAGVTYIHLMFDTHEIVMSDGLWTESFQPGAATLSGMDMAARDEIFALFPGRAAANALSYPSARSTLKRHEVRLILAS